MKTTRSDWLIPSALIALSLVPAVAGTARLAQLAGGASITPENARFFEAPLPVVLHIAAAIVFAILGAFQFSPGLRRRHRQWHRAAGRVLVVAALLVAISGLWMTLSYPWPRNDGQLVYAERLVFGSAMLLAVVLVDLEPTELPCAVMMGLGRAINIAVAEWVIRRPADPRPRTAVRQIGVRYLREQ